MASDEDHATFVAGHPHTRGVWERGDRLHTANPPSGVVDRVREPGHAGSVRHPSRQLQTAIALVLAVVLGLAGCSPGPLPTPAGDGSPTADATLPGTPSGSPGATNVPVPGHELYGFVPYWEMTDNLPDHLAATPLTTIGLFSVSHTTKGPLAKKAKGYMAIVSDTGRRIIREAQARGTRVEVVYTVFGSERTGRFFADAAVQAAAIASLAAFVEDLGLDGVNVDVEGLDAQLVPAYATFVGALREALSAAGADRQVSVATPARATGAAMAAAAVAAGADRVFLMGYDYRVAGSDPGATSPLDRRDDPLKPSLRRSVATYLAAGVPAERLLLGLPLYGIAWRVAGPVIGAPAMGEGDTWILRTHAELLGDPSIVPLRDDVEAVEVYLIADDGSVGPRTLDPNAPVLGWTAAYVDSPATIAIKLALADANGLAGGGFWAIGYERGLPGYTKVMEDFRAGRLDAASGG